MSIKPAELIFKAKKIDLYRIQCQDCGWKNSLNIMAHYCPKCGKNLWLGSCTEIEGEKYGTIEK